MKRLLLVGLLFVALAGAQLNIPMAEEQYIVPSGASAGDWFGLGLDSISDVMVIGAQRDDTLGADAGAVYVFTRSGSTWSQQQKLTASDGAAGDNFGSSVRMGGDATIVVGALNHDAVASNAGAAYVFTRSGSTWSQQQKLTASDGAAGDIFASFVEISGNTIVASAVGHDAVASNAGAAYVFTRSGSTWSQQQKLTASDAADSDEFGGDIGIIEGQIIVGARNAGGKGAAYVFTLSGSTWSQQQKLTASDGAAGDFFGFELHMNQDNVVVGARNHDAVASNAGAAYVFTLSGSTWSQQQKLIASDGAAGDIFGAGVGMFGDDIAVGAPNHNGSGAVYLFTLSGSTWSEQQKLTGSAAVSGDFFGTPRGISVWDDRVAVGAFIGESAYVFAYEGDPENNTDPEFEPTPFENSGLFGDNGPMWGGDKSALAATLQISETGLETGMAAIWILLFTATGFLAFNRSTVGALSGAGAGFVWSIAWGLLAMWVVFFAVIVALAGGYFFAQKRRA